MTMIRCPECGNMISDKASNCVKCGAPIVKKIKCDECGTQYDESKSKCPECGCPTPRTNNTGAGQQRQYTQTPPPGPMGYSQFAGNAQNMSREDRVQRFLMYNAKFFPQMRVEDIRSALMGLDDRKMQSVECMTFKDPMTMLLISIFLGGLGVDRFMLNEVGTGVAKLITCLICIGFVWWLIDLFQISDMTKEHNYKQLYMMLEYNAVM